MLMMLRHLLAIAVLPFTATVIVPVWIARRAGIDLSAGESPVQIVIQWAGLLVAAAGVLLVASSIRHFAAEGKGTLAPWDPPRRLVVRGPYRFVRNPMISGVAFGLVGEAMLLLSPPHAAWALAFIVANLIYIPLFEEPQLADRFGEAYREYCRQVPRLVPRLRPWSQS
jgi:protein-S-isoprenylcysteine O-methyltransferase Ste14